MHPYAFYYIFDERSVCSNFIFFRPKNTFEPNVPIFFINKNSTFKPLLLKNFQHIKMCLILKMNDPHLIYKKGEAH